MNKILQPLELKSIDNNAAYLLLISPEKIPHLVLVNQGKYFSLTYKNAIIAADFESYFALLKKNKLKLLFFKLTTIKEGVDIAFLNYKSVNTTAITCLVPIRDHLLPASNAQFVFELIPDLFHEKLIEEVYHVNMNAILDESGNFELNIYTIQDIFDYIKELNERHAQRT